MTAPDQAAAPIASETPPHPAATPAMGLVGVIDIGSNSIRLVVFEDGVRSPDYFFNEKVICGLGRGLSETGRLNADGRAAARAALRRYVSLSRRIGVSELIVFATAALREAEDGPEYRDALSRELDISIRVVTGPEEAKLAAEGVLFGWPAAEGVVADLGGASLELAEVAVGAVGATVSVPAGHLLFGEGDGPLSQRAMRALSAAAAPFAPKASRLILVGGAWRALAKAGMSRAGYPFHVLQGFEMTPKEAHGLCDWALSEPPAAIKKAAEVSNSRIPSMVGGARALKRLMAELTPGSVDISAFGVREGMIYERMAASMRAEEPLIAAATAMEARHARCPGFGAELFTWMRPLLNGFNADRMRLAEAVCLLHDVNWRAHPDFRVTACFGTVSRGNLAGVGHRGRLFLGAALMHRYKGDLQAAEAASVALMDADARREAEIVGRAARLGAMVSGSAIGTLGDCPLRVGDGRLTLSFAPAVADLAGERVKRRLGALAGALRLEPVFIA
ncbi:exopolyphosphatase [Pikeienuella piscinae]|uniref:Exopolyphosphatase n=1 Tax=Pikeienuella piscinae TaxID=2748098 RepID=A0A7L5BU41_9RHOB|nr:exopolyphosphatase [Pikeienuella piscinae]QIE54711.1 exopolyphosphatase [Pikeienuella piscinae]